MTNAFYSYRAELEKLRTLSFAHNIELNNAIRQASIAVKKSPLSNIAIQNAETFRMINEQSQHINSALKHVTIPFEIKKSLQHLREISNNFPRFNIEVIKNFENIAKSFQDLKLHHYKMISDVSSFLPKEQLNTLETTFEDFNNTYKESLDDAINTTNKKIEEDVDDSDTSPKKIPIDTLQDLIDAYVQTVDIINAIGDTPKALEHLQCVIEYLIIFISSLS
ncbi:MAG: hypothetical protein Q3988_07385 [Gemella sp.]|nr:hypothetical protein [Gemella sp.]